MLVEHGEVTLKSGEQARVVQVVPPEAGWRDRVLPVLGHKGDAYQWPMTAAFDGALPDLRTNFFECLIGDEIVGNITTVESQDPAVGILQHVFTNPSHRRKGICQVLMTALGRDFTDRGGAALYLGTGYDTPPYWIYHSFGFRGLGETGAMRWVVEDDFDTRYFAPGPVTIRETSWQDWPTLEALYLCLDGWYLRGFGYGQYGHSSYEGAYVMMATSLRHGLINEVKIMANAANAAVGHAMIAPQQQWRGGPQVLDFFVHPNFEAQAPALLEQVQYPTDRKVQCYCDAEATTRMAALEAAGFHREAVLPRQIPRGDEWLDAIIYAR